MQRVVLVIKDGDSGGAGALLERHVFDFVLTLFLAEKPTKEDFDALARCSGRATRSPISTLSPCPVRRHRGMHLRDRRLREETGGQDDLGAARGRSNA